jgi:SAM-dependent methyltransferase
MTSSLTERPSWSEDPLTALARTVWSAGDYLPIGRSYQAGAEAFVSRLALRPTEAVLDVGCGTGNVAVPAARAGARVWGIDLAPNLIAEARLEARTSGLPITFDVGDAESLPYADERFDTVVTMFGAMFAYRPERVARELIRVTRRGGRIAMANWTSEGLIGRLWRAHAALTPDPDGVPSPFRWGDEATVAARLERRLAAMTCTRRTIELRFLFPPAAVTELFAVSYGPTVTALRTLDPDGACRLRAALTRLFNDHNLADDGTTTLAGEYLDVEARVR